jgi:uracil-DNA glycosylase
MEDVMNKSWSRFTAEMRACRRCLEAGYDIVPGAVFSGDPAAEVMLIGQAPGVTEVEAKRPFNAGSGTRLFQWLGEAGWAEDAFRARHYMTAVTKCYPGKAANGKGDRVPTRAERRLCRPFLERELAFVRPRLLILVGGVAIKLVYPRRTRLKDVVGTAAYFPPAALADPATLDLKQAQRLDHFDETLHENGRWLVPLPHPSGASLWPNKPANQRLIQRAVDILDAIRRAWNL